MSDYADHVQAVKALAMRTRNDLLAVADMADADQIREVVDATVIDMDAIIDKIEALKRSLVRPLDAAEARVAELEAQIKLAHKVCGLPIIYDRPNEVGAVNIDIEEGT